jgi:hypothetical protein
MENNALSSLHELLRNHLVARSGTVCAETIDVLIDTNTKCRLFFKIDLQENLASLICLSELEFLKSLWGLGTEEE